MADVTINPNNVVPPNTNATTRLSPATYVIGEIIAAGEVVCLLASDSKLYRADANDADKRDVKGFAGNSGVAIGQRLDVVTKCPNMAVGAHGQAVGTPLYLSNTPGKCCPYGDLGSGSLPVLVAYAESATTLQVEIAAATAPKP